MKTKERTSLELLKLLKGNFDKYFNTGLCAILMKMLYHADITFRESKQLEILIRKNRPKNTWFYIIFIEDSNYYWRMGKKLPREKWINKMIKLYSIKE